MPRNQANMMQTQHLKLFPTSGPFEFIVMDILGPLLKTTNGNQFVVIMTDRYSKLPRGVPTYNSCAMHIATIFYDYCIVSYGIRVYYLTSNGTQLVSKFFKTIGNFLGLKHRTTTAYHCKTNGLAERYNGTLIARLCHYISEHQRD